MDEKTLEALLNIIDYLGDEQENYEERCASGEDMTSHIYLSVKLLEDWFYQQQPAASFVLEKFHIDQLRAFAQCVLPQPGATSPQVTSGAQHDG
jgi:hypothetical protein